MKIHHALYQNCSTKQVFAADLSISHRFVVCKSVLRKYENLQTNYHQVVRKSIQILGFRARMQIATGRIVVGLLQQVTIRKWNSIQTGQFALELKRLTDRQKINTLF